MCLNPIQITNNNKYIDKRHFHKYLIDIPCGKCAECMKNIKNEWYMRSYYQSVETFDKGGYVLFDTLTYDENNLPHLSDFVPNLPSELDYSCFNLEDYRLFFVRLRRYLGSKGYDIDKTLKYFLTSEYGTSDEGTHRPHYHILFYVTTPRLDPCSLSVAIDKCWQKGRTDGIKYKGRKYVLGKRVFSPTHCSDPSYLRSICNYVAKYVTKDSKFEAEINRRLYEVMNDRRARGFFNLKSYSVKVPVGYEPTPNPYTDYVPLAYEYKVVKNYMYNLDDWKDDPAAMEFYNKLKKQICQFHRQSQGFGLYALSKLDINDIFETGMMSMPDTRHIVKHIPAPMYYLRKLFYEQKTADNGSKYWQLSPLGIRYKVKRMHESIDRLASRFSDWYDNIETAVLQKTDLIHPYWNENLKRWDYVTPTEEECKNLVTKLKNSVDYYLNGRTFKQFAEYVIVYKNRIDKDTDLLVPPSVPDVILDNVTFLQEEKMKLCCNDLFFNYSTKTDLEHFGLKIVSNIYRGSCHEGYTNVLWQVTPDLQTDYDVVRCDDFAGLYLINEDSYCDFNGFDQLYSIYCLSLKYINARKQRAYEHLQNLSERLKSVGLFARTI